MDPWDHIFNTLGYKGEDEIIITANQIKACNKTWKGVAKQFEPRLLCYQTSANSRPEIFKKYGLNILPITNGTYRLSKTNVYMPLDYSHKFKLSINRDTSSVMLSLGGSETSLIDNMRYSGVFERNEILGEPITHGPLLNGRHRISIDMTLGSSALKISGVQYETDSCFESANKILIIEGKSSAKEIDSFNIRQLYFPFREAMRMAAGRKEVICLFIHDLNSLIHVWKYDFTDTMCMDSIILKGHYVYKYI
jgi:hypothetical protein